MNATRRPRARAAGFTLVELLISLTVFALVLAGSLYVFGSSLRYWTYAALDIDSYNEASVGLERLVYGFNRHPGLRQASTGDLPTFSGSNWSIWFCTSNRFCYNAATGVITNQDRQTVCSNIVWSSITRTALGELIITNRVAIRSGGISRTNDLTTSVVPRN